MHRCLRRCIRVGKEINWWVILCTNYLILRGSTPRRWMSFYGHRVGDRFFYNDHLQGWGVTQLCIIHSVTEVTASKITFTSLMCSFLTKLLNLTSFTKPLKSLVTSVAAYSAFTVLLKKHLIKNKPWLKKEQYYLRLYPCMSRPHERWIFRLLCSWNLWNGQIYKIQLFYYFSYTILARFENEWLSFISFYSLQYIHPLSLFWLCCPLASPRGITCCQWCQMTHCSEQCDLLADDKYHPFSSDQMDKKFKHENW